MIYTAKRRKIVYSQLAFFILTQMIKVKVTSTPVCARKYVLEGKINANPIHYNQRLSLIHVIQNNGRGFLINMKYSRNISVSNTCSHEDN